MKLPQPILPSFSIPDTPDLSCPVGLNVDHDGDNFDFSAFSKTFREKLRREREAREKGTYVKTFWFSCCMCEHPL
jgi:hypothetical protein